MATQAQRIAQLEAMILGMAQGAPVPEAPGVEALGFRSLGFVVTGNGEAPIEGSEISVPLKSGKTARVRLVDHIDTAPYEGEFGSWAFTYKRLRKS